MSQTYEQDKEHYLNNINRAESALTNILAHTHLNLLNDKQLDTLHNIQNTNKHLKHKLESNEFEIAIVGLEKAGKSTFANALIENYVLPSAPERCTFTATRLISGQDQARVVFYTEDEFNLIFQEMLQEVKYPNAQNANFRQIDLNEFTSYFDEELANTDNTTYKAHLGKTDEEIKEILKQKNKLTLTGETKLFSGDELTTLDFQSYIRGDNGDTSKPLSVKSIEIESSKLNQIENAVIYDVPGFDSPTQLHMRQTEERLKKADAIILVTNVGRNPSIQGTSLNVITKNTDEDGIALKDKLFVFGNQIDLVNGTKDLDGNRNILVGDVQKYKIGEAKRVFTGSAYKYLVTEKQIIEDDEYQCKYDIPSGIDDIRNSLVEYYETERFEILKRKIDSNLSKLKKVFTEISKNNEDSIIQGEDENFQKNKIFRTESKNIEQRIRKSLKEFMAAQKEKIYDEKWLSNHLKSGLEFSPIFNELSEEKFYQAKILNDESIRRDIPYEKVNNAIRSELHQQSLADYIDLIKNITAQKCYETEKELQKAFTAAVAGNNRYSEAIENRCAKFLQQATTDIQHNSQRFTYLVERFSRGIFDILLEFSLGNSDRNRRFEENKADILMLDHYYSRNEGRLISVLLTQKNGEDTARQLKMLSGDMLKFVQENLGKAAGILNSTTAKAAYEILNSLYYLAPVITGIKSSEKLVEGDKIVRAQSETDVINEINTDLSNLRDILINAVIPAISLETAFVNSLDKQVKLVLNAADGNGQANNLFDQFLAEIIPLTCQSDYHNITNIIELQKAKKEVLTEIAEF